MFSKRLLLLVGALLVFSVALAACNGADTDTGDNELPGNCADEDVFCVGFVTDVGRIDDKSFNQSSWVAVQQARDELDAHVAFVETQDAKDYAANIDLFGAKDADVIVTSGFAMGDATAEGAVKYPDIQFIGIDQFQAPPDSNFTGVLFPEDKSGFLAGALAAMLSESGTVAGVYGTDLVPPVVAFREGYEAGAAYINPDINVSGTYHPGGLDVAFTDPDWGATTARQAIDQGADVVFAAAGQTGNGAIIETAGQEGLWCIGVDTDQWETVPEAHPCLVTSAMKLITPVTFDLIRHSVDGTFPGGIFLGPVGLASFHDFEDSLSDEIKAELERIDAGLKDGSIETGYVPG
jgi:basic membrane protein A